MKNKNISTNQAVDMNFLRSVNKYARSDKTKN